jgi:hypothetical protein
MVAAAVAEEQLPMIREDAALLASSSLRLLDDILSLLNNTHHANSSSAQGVATAGRQDPEAGRQSDECEKNARADGMGAGSEQGTVVGPEASANKLAQMDATIRRLQASVAEIGQLVRQELSLHRGAAVSLPRSGNQTPARNDDTRPIPPGYPATPLQAGDQLQTAEAEVSSLADKVDTIRRSRSPEASHLELPETERQLREAQQDAAEAQRKLALLREWVADNWPLGLDQGASDLEIAEAESKQA